MYENDYGKIILDAWWKEENYFVDEILIPELVSKFKDEYIMKVRFWTIRGKTIHEIDITSKKNSLLGTITVDVYTVMHEEFFKHYNNRTTKSFDKKVITGVDYEDFIKSVFQQKGYKVHKTPVTGDQGVDLIAEKGEKRIAIQCKFYHQPVGNKAVQEVVAGRKFYDCNHAMVITNSSFTKSAKILAKNTDVELLTILVSDTINEIDLK